MRLSNIAKFVLLALLLGGACTIGAGSARAATPYCPNPAHQRPHKVPPHLVARVAKALHISNLKFVRGTSFVRCEDATLMACTIGANLICGKADTSRRSPGATAWCHDHPGDKIVPLSATGHATIYTWTCVGDRAVAGKPLVTVDRHGYIAGNWTKVP